VHCVAAVQFGGERKAVEGFARDCAAARHSSALPFTWQSICTGKSYVDTESSSESSYVRCLYVSRRPFRG